jgi:uncharacterized protein YndB with AHSA1/START domain
MTSTTLVRRIAARPAIVFDAIVTEAGIRSWWGPDAEPAISAVVDSQVGGTFRVCFRTDDGLVHECAGEFLEIERPLRVVLNWRWVSHGAVEERDNVSRVEFQLRPIDSGTELTLIHAGLGSDASAEAHQRGWNGALSKLIRQVSQTEEAPS